ncbi:MAG: LLM class flavin-dependent oxidoreductase [Brumimicrobium sp.]
MIPFNYLDLANVSENDTLEETFKNSVKIAQTVEENGFSRIWFAEHHNTVTVASSATSILIGHIAGKTKTIRVGSGGVMLPNHSPLVIAEQFGTLATLYPNRIDLGLGRAPGTDQLTARYINPNFRENAIQFPERLRDLQQFLSKDNASSMIRAIPGEGTEVPIWILGSSTDSAYLASTVGLPYAFASHFAPAQMKMALDIYENNSIKKGFKPHKMIAINIVIGETNKDAERIATSMYRMFLGLFRNERKPIQPPIETMEGFWSKEEEFQVKNMLKCSFIGDKNKVKKELEEFIEEYKPDELIITAPAFSLEDKIYSVTEFAKIMRSINKRKY